MGGGGGEGADWGGGSGKRRRRAPQWVTEGAELDKSQTIPFSYMWRRMLLEETSGPIYREREFDFVCLYWLDLPYMFALKNNGDRACVLDTIHVILVK